MKGLEIARRYYVEHGKSMIEASFGAYADRIACGLVGEGSECLGFDDERSRDHDFGATFCMWLTDADYDAIGAALNVHYETLPEAFLGYPRRSLYSYGEQRVGAMRTSDFYRKFTSLGRAPETLSEWRRIPETFLSAATSGAVFDDSLGEFKIIRDILLAYYPEDIRLKKLTARIGVMAQSGQYNYGRCIARAEYVAAACALAEFIGATCSAVYLLNKRYMPFYKWAHHGLKFLPVLNEAYDLLAAIAEPAPCMPSAVSDRIESICGLVIGELKAQELSDISDDFLLPHCNEIMKRIRDPEIGHSHIFAE